MLTDAAKWDALGDGTRRAIVDRLAERPRAVGELAAELPVSRPAVSQHLRVLKAAGLVSERAEGTRRIYRLEPAALVALRDQLDAYWSRALANLKDVVEGEDQAVTEAASTVVRREIVVEAPAARAFEVFTTRFDDIKPHEHTLLSAPIAETVFERHVGGHIYDRAVDGSECRWGRVLVYDPPHRVVFSWDIGPDWQLVSDPAQASEVEVSFVAEGDSRTRVALEHRHLERHGPGWEAARDGVDSADGWPLYLTRLAALL